MRRLIALCALGALAIARAGLAQETEPIPKNYFVPAFDDRSSISRNLHGPWVVDNDPFSTNQLMHPYQGAM
jgi:hypothetical protein